MTQPATRKASRPRLATAGLHGRLAPFLHAQVISPGSAELLDILARRWGCTAASPPEADALLALALTLEAVQRGHSALPLADAARFFPALGRGDGAGRPAAELAAEGPPERAADDEGITEDHEAGEDEAGEDEGSAPLGAGPGVGAPGAGSLPWPADLEAWTAAVNACPLVQQREATATSGAGEPLLPFCWVEGDTPADRLLSTQRMASEERRVAGAIQALRAPPPPGFFVPDAASVDAAVARHFSGSPDSAGARALRQIAAARFAVITGGPGTGKTWSIKRVLEMLLRAHAPVSARPLTVALAAPTGKAAVRMEEAMREDLGKLDTRDDIRRVLGAIEARTLHRLLGIRPDGGARHGRSSPLPYDVVVVDEASMIDLPLMRKLLEAVAADARLILLGDRDQLPSVDVGSVLGEIVRDALADPDGPADPGDVIRFAHNHRSGHATALAELIGHLQTGQDDEAVHALTVGRGDSALADRLRHRGPPQGGRPTPDQLDALFSPFARDEGGAGEDGSAGASPEAPRHRPPSQAYFGLLAHLLKEEGVSGVPARAAELLQALDRYRVLTAHRRGPLGVSGLSRALTTRAQAHLRAAMAERRQAKAAVAAPTAPPPVRPQVEPVYLPTSRGLWLGQPILVTENTHDANLYNGDIGVVLPDPADPRRLAVAFPAPPRGEADGAAAPADPVRWVPISRLPAHADAMVLTIHKSQGSQFGHVALALAEGGSALHTRELIYTGITRAQERVSWIGRPEDLAQALKRRVERGSGLARRLRPSGVPAPRASAGPPAEPPAPPLSAPAPAAAGPDARADLSRPAGEVLEQVDRLRGDHPTVTRKQVRAALAHMTDTTFAQAVNDLCARRLLAIGPGYGGTLRPADPPSPALVARVLARVREAGARETTRALNRWAKAEQISPEAVDDALSVLEALGHLRRDGAGWAPTGRETPP